MNELKEQLIKELNKDEELLENKVRDMIVDYYDISDSIDYKKLNLILAILNMAKEDVVFMHDNIDNFQPF